MEIQDWGVIISLSLSFISIVIVIYNEFIRSFKISTIVNRISFQRIPNNNKSNIILEVLVDDLLSSSPSTEANVLIDKIPELKDNLKTKNRSVLANILIKESSTTPLNYNSPIHILEKWFKNKNFGTSFYTPLQIHNSGKKTAFISNLFLIFKNSKNEKYLFQTFTEVNADALINRKENPTDADRTSKIVTGYNIGPVQSISINPLFIPIHELNNQIISRTNIKVGKYNVSVIGTGYNNKIIFKTKEVEINITKDNFINSFNGSDEMIFLGKGIDVSKL